MKNNINLTTFDNENELEKLKKYAPHVKCLLRIKIDDTTARCELGSKYGAEKNEYTRLLKIAASLNIKIIGTTFHVGSDAKNPDIFRYAIHQSHKIFKKAKKLGHNMTILNIGGGFKSNIPQISAAINDSINKYFPPSRDIDIIAEPGRFFSESMSTLACKIIGKKKYNKKIKYWITDGLYGSMNSIIYNKTIINPIPIQQNKNECKNNKIYDSIIFGPTCDSFDVVSPSFPLTELQINDWFCRHKHQLFHLYSPLSFFWGIPYPFTNILG